jgi:hypothetical protein
MVLVYNIRTVQDLRNVDRDLQFKARRLPYLNKRITDRWGKVVVRDMKISAQLAGINPFTGTLQDSGIRWESHRDGGSLWMRQYGIALDSMPPHFVTVRKSRTRLLNWMLQARSLGLRIVANQIASGKRKRFGLYVKPHPFIQTGYKMARPKLTKIMKYEYDKEFSQK